MANTRIEKNRYQALPLVPYLGYSYWITKADKKTERLEKIFNHTYQDVENVADAFQMKQQK